MNPPARYSACIKAFLAGIIKKYGSYLYYSFRTDVAERKGFEPLPSLHWLPHFECGPFDHLGISPFAVLLYRKGLKKSSPETRRNIRVSFFQASSTRCSPILYTSPAPTVRMMSPGSSVSRRDFSSSSKDGKKRAPSI